MVIFQPQFICMPKEHKFFANHVAGYSNDEWPNSEEPAYHDFFECELFVQGAGSLFINSKEYHIKPGLFYILEPSSHHMYRATQDIELELYNLKFSSDLISSDVRELLSSQKSPHACLFDEDFFERMRSKINEIIRITEGKYVPSSDYHLKNRFVKGMVDEVVLTYLAHTTTNHIESETQNVTLSKRFQNLIQWINEHYSESITAHEAAEVIGLSSKYFSRYFKQHANMSFNEYVYRTRISRAMDMLNNTNLSIKEICYETGFSSSAHFTKTFVKYVGITPTAYRNKAKY